MPDWLGKMFTAIDKKDFATAKAFLADDVDFYWANYHLKGRDPAIKFVGGFNSQFSEYHHDIEYIWEGKSMLMFGGNLRFVIDDGTSVITPFVNIFEMSPDGHEKIVRFQAILSVAAFPLKYWQHLTTKDLDK